MARRHDDQELNTAVPTDFNRIYVGSLDYFAKPADVEELLVGAKLNSFQKIHISIDPISGRNLLFRRLSIIPRGCLCFGANQSSGGSSSWAPVYPRDMGDHRVETRAPLNFDPCSRDGVIGKVPTAPQNRRMGRDFGVGIPQESKQKTSKGRMLP